MTTDTPIRKSVPLTPDEVAALNAARTDGSPAHEALVELLGHDATGSEAATLQALVQLGFSVVRERAMDHGYAALAAMQDQDDRDYEAVMRQRVRDTED